MKHVKSDLEKYISLTFDENPEVRKQAAEQLAKIDDPAATVALLDLCYDKDERVRKTAMTILKGRKAETNPSVDIYSLFQSSLAKNQNDEKKEKTVTEEEQKQEKQDQKHELSKTEEDEILEQVACQLEKLPNQDMRKKTMEKLRKIVALKVFKENKVMQEVLTPYLDVVASIDEVGDKEEKATEQPKEQQKLVDELNTAPDEEESNIIHQIGKHTDIEEIGYVSSEDETKLSKELEEMSEVEEEEQQEEDFKSNSLLMMVYETMMLSDGDEKVMKQQKKKIEKRMKEEIELAFKLAKQRFKRRNITNLTEIKDGMKNINTPELEIKKVTVGTYKRTKKKEDVFTRLEVVDEEGNEGVVYILGKKHDFLKPGMRVVVKYGLAKTIPFSGETAITVAKKGDVYLILS